MEFHPEEDWGVPSEALAKMALGPAGQTEGTREFHPFPKLPIELRFQIWHDTWIPACVDLWHLGKQRYRGLAHIATRLLPASAHVNHESREETLREYYKIPDTPALEFRACINYDLDTLSVDRYTGCAAEFPDNIFSNFKRMDIQLFLMHKYHDWHHPTPATILERWIRDEDIFAHRPDYETLDNFVRYVWRRYFPSLQQIKLELYAPFVRFPIFSRIHPDIVASLHPFFIRTLDGRGLEFLPGIHGERQWKAMEIRVVGEDEAAGRDDAERARDHQGLLNYLTLCLWHVFAPNNFLKGDREVEQLVNEASES
ncbi:hypothetical protein PG993_008752 [Apiospora rasikravindrae]|uniref:2EXR domain-containing protein n=1 Tax=Apiospora rasikravindrae TaxID=990691 RepID=A0ABR1SRK0_9PEZI